MDINKYIVSDKMTVKKTIEIMETNNVKAVIVLNEKEEVVGLFSNGDMRSYFLKGGTLDTNIRYAMNSCPVLFNNEFEAEEDHKTTIRVIYPIVDNRNHLVNVIDYDKTRDLFFVSDCLKDIPLVVMAGGKGTRLYPYTKILPKPLIPIGELTITERIIESFRRFGCRDIYMILNYKANMIKAYMADIEKDYELKFVEEKEFLGTGGGLRLVRENIHSTFFVSNCDILVNADLECAYRTHVMKKNKITFICSMKDVVIPYGVIETDESGMIKNMKEKPEFSYLINTGLYIIEPDVLNDIRENEFIHLPDLAKRYIDRGENVGVFPISEKSWMDMGQFAEMESMKKKLGV